MPDIINNQSGSQQQVVVPDPNAQAQTNPQDDIIKRAAQFKPTEPTDPQPNESSFNTAEFDTQIDAIEDEGVKNSFKALQKSLVTGVNNKYQDIATLRKDLEAKIEQSNTSNQNQPWTVDRVQSLLNDPTFVQSASQISNTQTTTDDSMMSEAEKQRLSDVENQNKRLLQQTLILQKQTEDKTLQVKYPDYNSQAIDTIQFDIAGKMQKGEHFNSREILHKYSTYDVAVERAYKMGRQDERQGITDNVQAASYEGGQVTQSGSVKKEKGETGPAFLRRLYANNVKK